MGKTVTTSAHGCPHFDCNNRTHLTKYLEALTRIRLKRVLTRLNLSARTSLLSTLNIKDTEEEELQCFKCKKGEEESPKPLYVCCTCHVAGCWSSEFHLKAHFNEAHQLAIEVSSGTIYCGLCHVFIWNAVLDALATSPSSLDRLLSQAGGASKQSSPSKKKKSGDSLTESGEVTVKHCYPLRGMINMGNTCFMASVLQVLLHCRPLKDYFLNCQHLPKQCPKKNQKSSVCMACELDRLFNQNFSGETCPLAPFEFLHGMWRSSKHLSGYEQQDAHEFLISLLNQLHSDLGGSHFACKCPVHTHFTGVLQSDVTCLSCGTVNASFDPFIDISLDILTSANDSSFVFDPNTSSLTLNECFTMFTHAENLSSNTYMCATCNHTYQEATKQLSIRKAPEILTIHLKRFEHSFNTVKIDTFLQFPSEFSIFDYTTEGVHLSHEVNRISAHGSGLNALNQPSLSPSVIDPAYNSKKYSKDMLYRLVATVNHSGVVDSGHYISFVRTEDDSWFKFDDATVSKVPAMTVLNSNPYMLLYARISDSSTQSPDVISIE